MLATALKWNQDRCRAARLSTEHLPFSILLGPAPGRDMDGFARRCITKALLWHAGHLIRSTIS